MSTHTVPAHSIRRLLTERQAGERLAISHRTLQQWRVRGNGPAFLKLGNAVRYDADALDAWVSDQVHRSTSA
jgi:predicted DNA-binding transcriptional regulator AlpA